jgi:hypothetical protein
VEFDEFQVDAEQFDLSLNQVTTDGTRRKLASGKPALKHKSTSSFDSPIG